MWVVLWSISFTYADSMMKSITEKKNHEPVLQQSCCWPCEHTQITVIRVWKRTDGSYSQFIRVKAFPYAARIKSLRFSCGYPLSSNPNLWLIHSKSLCKSFFFMCVCLFVPQSRSPLQTQPAQAQRWCITLVSADVQRSNSLLLSLLIRGTGGIAQW